ncbi:class III lanthionine synthetase LanKC [Marilutibacter alkalisoli]|nr:class III lanthionine synthetase LanKC [Lysobacter alkalisoli]
MNFDDHPFMMHTLLDRDHYEPISRYAPKADYLDIVRKRLVSGWKLVVDGFWTHCTPEDYRAISHGWKIHVSSTTKDARAILEIVSEVLEQSGTAFKFCSDPWLLRLTFNKNASRVQAGKFVTIYPRDAGDMRSLLDALHRRTRSFTGPYVLTDKPYRDSNVIFYRYGEHVGEFRLNRYGNKESGFRLADGSWHSDSRAPGFRLPPGITDPFGVEEDEEGPGEDGVLLKDRYRVTAALKFNAIGGVYEAIDQLTGDEVVIREERGGMSILDLNAQDDSDAIMKEARIVKRLSETGYVPRFVDVFKEWKNWFLVTEKVDGESLWGHSMNFYFEREGKPPGEAFSELREIMIGIATGLSAVHRAGVVLRDVTRNNVLVTRDGGIKFIDFEFSHEIDDEGPWVHGWTPGYAAADQISNKTPVPADDHYAFGVLLLDMLTYSAPGFELNRQGLYEKLRQNIEELKFPPGLYDIVAGLTASDPGERWNLEDAADALNALPVPSMTESMFHVGTKLQAFAPPAESLRESLDGLLQGIGAYIEHSTVQDRDDRMWPTAAEAFVTNPVNLQHGAAGPVIFLQRARGRVGPTCLDWIERRANVKTCPPGLLSGLAGVAVVLVEAGRTERAEDLMAASHALESIHDAPGLFYGSAGWGLACLHLWLSTDAPIHLERAIEVGDRLIETSIRTPEGVCWRTESDILLGLGEGQSGVALFLSYLGKAAGDQRYLQYASDALDFEIAHSIESGGELLWQPRVDARPGEAKSPHTWFGASGVGSACLRHYRATGEERFLRIAERCAHTAGASRFTNKMWQVEGIAGFGEFMLDMHQLLGEENYRNAAFHLAEALIPHRIERKNGVAFAGSDHYRICCDFGRGSAGIGIFLQRLFAGGPRLLMLDHLLEAGPYQQVERAAVTGTHAGDELVVV